MATRATVSGPDVGRGEAAGEGEDGAVDVVEVGLGAQRADLGLPVRRTKVQFHQVWQWHNFTSQYGGQKDFIGVALIVHN